MRHRRKSLQLLGLLTITTLGMAGCSDKPHDYGHRRPDVDSLSKNDRGLQSKDVVQASDEMAMSLLRVDELSDSRTQWTVVVTGVENMTSQRRHAYDIFIQRLKVNLATQGHGRIRLIENRDRFRDLQNRELEPETGGPPRRGETVGPAGVQPQFALHAQVADLPNRGTNYFLFTFDLTDLRSREIVWGDKYEVKVER